MNDLISRQAAIDVMAGCCDHVRPYMDAWEGIKKLPSAQPEQRTGHWKEHIFDGIMGGRPRALMCSYCNRISLCNTNYCPNCGAYMMENSL